MPQMKRMVNGQVHTGFTTPTVQVLKGDKLTTINGLPGGAALALAIGYLFEVVNDSNVSRAGGKTSTAFENKTARNSAHEIIPSLKKGDKNDVFRYLLPGYNPDGTLNVNSLTEVYAMSRQDLMRVADELIKVDAPLKKAEELARGSSEICAKLKLDLLNPFPVFPLAVDSTKAKRGGGGYVLEV